MLLLLKARQDLLLFVAGLDWIYSFDDLVVSFCVAEHAYEFCVIHILPRDTLANHLSILVCSLCWWWRSKLDKCAKVLVYCCWLLLEFLPAISELTAHIISSNEILEALHTIVRGSSNTGNDLMNFTLLSFSEIISSNYASSSMMLLKLIICLSQESLTLSNLKLSNSFWRLMMF